MADQVKEIQRPDDDGIDDYKAMRRSFDRYTPYTNDIDQLEWIRNQAGDIVFVGLLEITKRRDLEKYGPEPTDAFFEAVLNRYNNRSSQGKVARTAASLLGCPAYIVAYDLGNLSRLWVYPLSSNGGWSDGFNGWRRYTQEQYEDFIMGLKRNAKI